MGKGDKKSRRGKLRKGSYGKRRPRQSNKVKATVAKAPQPPQTDV